MTLLSKQNTVQLVQLMWVTGNTGVGGNEKADTIAKTAASTPFVGPIFGISKQSISAATRKWTVDHYMSLTAILSEGKQKTTGCSFSETGALNLYTAELVESVNHCYICVQRRSTIFACCFWKQRGV